MITGYSGIAIHNPCYCDQLNCKECLSRRLENMRRIVNSFEFAMGCECLEVNQNKEKIRWIRAQRSESVITYKYYKSKEVML